MIRSNCRLCCWLGILTGLLACRLQAADGPWNVGPLWDEFPLTLDSGERTEAWGPLFYCQTRDTEHTMAVPPLLCHVSDDVADWDEIDFLYPLVTYDRFGTEHRWQFIQLFSVAGGINQDETARKRFTIFPFYFQQRSPDPGNNYTALFPIYGHLQNRLFRDEIHFVLFPLYGQSRKRDVVTDNYLFPFFHLRHGNRLQGWQFWPLVGHEHKDVTWVTNGFGDAEIVGGHDKWFSLWPIYFNYATGIGTENPAKEIDVLPFYAQYRSPLRDTTSVLWPFFNYIDDRGRKYREWEGPWPLVIFARGEGKTTSRILPLFSRQRSDTQMFDSYLWPVYKYKRLHAGSLDRQRWQVLYFLFSHVRERNAETGGRKTRTDFLPLFTYRRDYNGNTRLQILAPIEPVLPNNKSVERNWSPVWSLWRSEHNPTAHASSQSLLWNLFRREASPASKKCSLLFGIFQYESTTDARRLRLFFVPVFSSHKDAPPAATETSPTPEMTPSTPAGNGK